MCFGESTLEPSTTHWKQWSGKAEDERTRDQDGMEKPIA